ncbi:hypothetical protein MKY29_09465 [Psychrobacillus sp. FSL K6-2365]|uniref:hypothetical protein n=1 Tax=Psychrobacillus sp. FSL K6-2365 TaxID=2921546 RepID=UPI0030F9B886
MVNSHFTWSISWIHPYESTWGIFEKFKYANAIDSDTILSLFGNDNVQRLKKISNAGSGIRNLISLDSIDPKLTEKIIGINLVENQNNQMEKLIHILPNVKYVGDYIRNNLSYCPECLKSGFHSIFHQIRFFDYCAFHPNQKLLKECINCNKLMPEYIINNGKITAFHCSCGYSFLGSDYIRTVFKSWQFQPLLNEKNVATWLELDKAVAHKYSFVYPLNYTKDLGLYKNEIDYLPQVAELFIAAIKNEQNNIGTVKIASKQNIFKMKSNDHRLQEEYKEVFSYRFTDFEFKERDQLDSIFFEIYKQTRSIYKSITRYILRKLIKDHHKCIKIFNKARLEGHICPHALAFILWKMECEGKNTFSEIESHRQITKSYDFECVNEQFTIFPQGVFMTHLKEFLNSSSKEKGFNLLELNVRSLNFIVNRLTSNLLIERYIKWLEIVQQPKKIKHFHLDDRVPAYLIQIPLNRSGEISFYFPNHRYQYMRTIINDIKKQKTCPTNKFTHYAPYKSPLRIVLERMET